MSVGERKLWYLRRLNLFADLSPAEVETVARHLRERTFRRGEMILDADAPADRIYVIKSGAVRVYRTSPVGRELTTAILWPGQLLGTAALVGADGRGAFAEVVEDSCLCEATADEFRQLIRSYPLLAERIIVLLARQLLRLEQQLERFAFQEVPTRLAQTLLQLAEDHGGQLPPNLTHEELAKLVGTTRATVTRTLAQFAERRLVDVGYRRLAIADLVGLRREAGLGDGQRSDGHE